MGSDGAPLALQRLWEKVTLRVAGDHQTRHPLPLVERAGFVVQDSRRSRAGTVERLRAIKDIRIDQGQLRRKKKTSP